jgi:hypothetical protein
MPRPVKSTMFQIAERVVVNLYDGGVLSPAVLERVLAAFADSAVDWATTPAARSVDGRSLHEIVVSIMLPGKAPRNASAEFSRIVEHIATAASGTTLNKPAPKVKQTREPDDEAEDGGDNDAESDELVSQLSGSTQASKRANTRAAKPSSGTRGSKRPATQPAAGKPAGFNPFVNAAPPRKSK